MVVTTRRRCPHRQRNVRCAASLQQRCMFVTNVPDVQDKQKSPPEGKCLVAAPHRWTERALTTKLLELSGPSVPHLPTQSVSKTKRDSFALKHSRQLTVAAHHRAWCLRPSVDRLDGVHFPARLHATSRGVTQQHPLHPNRIRHSDLGQHQHPSVRKTSSVEGVPSTSDLRKQR